MKPILALILVTTLASARAQQPPQATPVPPRAPPAPHEIEKRIEKTVEDTLRAVFEVTEQAPANGLRIAQRAVAAAAQNAEAQLQDLNTYTTLYGASYGGSGTSRGNRSLVIQSSEPDPVANANAEEDLAIMSRILRKAVGSSQDDGRRMVMNIPVDGSVFGSASGARNIYIDGYGALFLLTVRYPLIAPAEKTDEPKAKDTTSDEWKVAQEEELESRGRPGGYGSASGSFSQSWSLNSGRGPAEDYDADKVDKLKTALLESLKNATHIRALKPNDFVTVVVQGAEATRTEVMKRKPSNTALGKPEPAEPGKKSAGGAPSVSLPGKTIRTRSGQGETVMTIRVKKSDADAFAQGKLDLDAFRKKAAIQTYFRRTDSTSASAFVPPVR